MRRSLVCLLSLMVALPATAQIYKYTDANGSTAYSNQPPAGTKAQVVDLPPLNNINTVKPTPTAPATANTPMPSQIQYSELELTDLPDDEALRANNGNFTVGVKIRPKLDPGFMFQLLVDGNPYGQPTNVPRLQVVNIDRGEHSLAVQVLDSQRVVQQSPTVTISVMRAHVGKP